MGFFGAPDVLREKMKVHFPMFSVVQGTALRTGLRKLTVVVDGLPWPVGSPELKRIQHMVLPPSRDTDRSGFCRWTDAHGTGQPKSRMMDGRDKSKSPLTALEP